MNKKIVKLLWGDINKILVKEEKQILSLIPTFNIWIITWLTTKLIINYCKTFSDKETYQLFRSSIQPTC